MTRILLTVFVVITAVIGAGVYFSSQDGGTAGAGGTQGDGEAQVVRENSHRLSSPPDSDVTFVEFLDFEFVEPSFGRFTVSQFVLKGLRYAPFCTA